VVEGLDLPVVVGCGYGGEEHLNAQVQVVCPAT
jgi:hypothetical protein